MLDVFGRCTGLPTRETSYSDQTLTFANHSKKIQKVVRPTRYLRQQRPPRRKKNGDLSTVFFQSGRAKDLSAPLVAGRDAQETTLLYTARSHPGTASL